MKSGRVVPAVLYMLLGGATEASSTSRENLVVTFVKGF